ncbi:hypothetical protein NE237_024516 [Protea cynaroides]|uniref:Uncharacterized protein n=1 Tax=Protea cynaroides TaxID=273540 RepID=A0A9Q0H1A4_9MAGN|nr:hypothetical protein NE237_024516 [Protea cynaroides]
MISRQASTEVGRVSSKGMIIAQDIPSRVSNPRVSEFDISGKVHIPWPVDFGAGYLGRALGAGFVGTVRPMVSGFRFGATHFGSGSAHDIPMQFGVGTDQGSNPKGYGRDSLQTDGVSQQSISDAEPLGGVYTRGQVLLGNQRGVIDNNRSGVPTPVVDIGGFIGMPPYILENQKDSLVSSDKDYRIRSHHRRKRSQWTVNEKGKAPVVSDQDVLQGVKPSNVKQNAGVASRSFVQLTGGLPDLNSLPKPVISGGVTRVTLPQEVVDKQMAKYQLALIGRVFTPKECC